MRDILNLLRRPEDTQSEEDDAPAARVALELHALKLLRQFSRYILQYVRKQTAAIQGYVVPSNVTYTSTTGESSDSNSSRTPALIATNTADL